VTATAMAAPSAGRLTEKFFGRAVGRPSGHTAAARPPSTNFLKNFSVFYQYFYKFLKKKNFLEKFTEKKKNFYCRKILDGGRTAAGRRRVWPAVGRPSDRKKFWPRRRPAVCKLYC
jgi:hypothetical protein